MNIPIFYIIIDKPPLKIHRRTAARFRSLRKCAAVLREGFAACENVPLHCGKVSQLAKMCRCTAGRFRSLRKRAAILREGFYISSFVMYRPFIYI